jgi:hypothetical protein
MKIVDDLFLAAWIVVAGLTMRWNARKTMDTQRRETPTVRIRRVTP